MLHNPNDLKFERLPDTLPVFPLAGTLLLPGGQIPLHIFEPRYLNMVQDALASQDRLIGIMLPKGKSIQEQTPVYTTGCAGRITSFEEMADGRFLIKLTGYCRFDTGKEVKTMRGYRRFAADWEPYRNDTHINPHVEIERLELIGLIQDYARHLSIFMDWSVLEHTPNFNLITFFSMSLPFADADKQKIMEALTLEDRAKVLAHSIKKVLKEVKE